jgi:rhodanese-related sulfurtransferase
MTLFDSDSTRLNDVSNAFFWCCGLDIDKHSIFGKWRRLDMAILSKLFGKKDSGPTVIKGVAKSVLLDKIKQSELFKNLPSENLEQVFAHMETVEIREGDTVIREGDEGDYYYLLVKGAASVTRRLHPEGKPQVVAQLTEPTGFGEEALISNAKRNATITMATDGTVMRLSKDAFNDYVKEPLITWISPKDAQDKVAKGAKWIDVRDPEDVRQSHLHGSLSIPMADLRNRMGDLDKNTLYVCYCQNGRLSSTAAFLLRQRGFNVGALRGGLQSLQRAGVT